MDMNDLHAFTILVAIRHTTLQPALLLGSQAGRARRGKLLVRLIEARNLTFHTGMMTAFHTLVRSWLHCISL